ncbi:dTDP-4-dehydrorhamnose 3,5-epimerase (EC [Olavius algarvensis associated proteobacterium Delta 3]|nr:dTDP-4-dehydrorhamnose 3,5-epimerase (EC [Olavius algarvensis associated proteobacterium Delta 3]CAB5123132.1 dTDP-4-dehydrorhamnose 3,5-epimerase (EC [Olavius algarvensis associated proteobacterium Delta 3]
MQLSVKNTLIDSVKIVIPEVFQDDRGFFMEVYREDQFSELGLPSKFVQFNHSGSVQNTLRGLHFQWDPPMGKFMRVTRGTAFLVAVDIRKGSPTLGKWVGIEASEENRLSVWAPAGFARGFCVVSEYAEIQYLTTGTYNSNCESGILWNDEAVGIEWPVKDPVLSEKDKVAQTLSQWHETEESEHFQY